jgi:hypothetical protein
VVSSADYSYEDGLEIEVGILQYHPAKSKDFLHSGKIAFHPNFKIPSAEDCYPPPSPLKWMSRHLSLGRLEAPKPNKIGLTCNIAELFCFQYRPETPSLQHPVTSTLGPYRRLLCFQRHEDISNRINSAPVSSAGTPSRKQGVVWLPESRPSNEN